MPLSSAVSRRIVVTGMGMVSPLGCGVELAWQRLLQAYGQQLAADTKG